MLLKFTMAKDGPYIIMQRITTFVCSLGALAGVNIRCDTAEAKEVFDQKRAELKLHLRYCSAEWLWASKYPSLRRFQLIRTIDPKSAYH